MTEENDIIKNRRDKLRRLRAAGKAYPNTFQRENFAADLQATFVGDDKQSLQDANISVSVAGRIMLRRVMGKASFITLADLSGQIQCYLRKDDLGTEAYDAFDDLFDIGDIVGVKGILMRTNKGELSVHASELVMLTKSLRPLPEKYHGLTDTETKYRQRYLDLIMSEGSRKVFAIRAQVIQTIREFFLNRRYMEVETPMLHAIQGGAAARPFETHHNSLDLDLYLRIAPELHLKRLVVGGFERVFEINRCFRNEGLSTRHNPEFTTLEFYQAYAQFTDLMALTEELVKEIALKAVGSLQLEYQGQTIDLAPPWQRITMVAAIAEQTGLTPAQIEDPVALRETLTGLNLSFDDDWGLGKLQTQIFEARVEDTLIQPTFITHYPMEVSPLSRRNDEHPEVTDRFEWFVAGREVANAFSELNDPEDQAERFRAQAELHSSGDHEAMHYDADYITALEYGLPPTAGEGIGIDRLVMLLTDSASIRDVLLFPLMRPWLNNE